jgi:hypothetical protein
MTRLLWAIERREWRKWVLLPNTVMTRRCHAAFDMKCLREEKNGETYRLVSYERRLTGQEVTAILTGKRSR